MPKLFPKKTVVVQTGGGGVGGTDGLLITDGGFKFTIGTQDSNAAISTAETFAINLTQPESNAAQTEAIKASLSGSAFNDSNAAQTEARNTFQRYWASASSDNDSSRTTPANANGQPDGSTSTVKTALQIGDLTNPVILSSTTFNNPTSGSFTSKKLRVFFSVPSRITALDTITLKYDVGSGDVTFYTHSGTAAVDYLSAGFPFDVSALTLTQLSSLTLKASYQDSVVATPETRINLDAWCVELEGGI